MRRGVGRLVSPLGGICWSSVAYVRHRPKRTSAAKLGSWGAVSECGFVAVNGGHSLVVMIQELRRVVDHPSRPVDPAGRETEQSLRFRREDDLEVLVGRFSVRAKSSQTVTSAP
jgi:hypothetical protein